MSDSLLPPKGATSVEIMPALKIRMMHSNFRSLKDYVLVLLFLEYVSDKYAGVPFAPITIPKGGSFKDMVALTGRIRRECRAHDIEPPVYDFEMSGLMLPFHANPAYLQASSSESRANERLGETRAAIIRTMLANSKVTTTQLAKSLSISTTAVEKNIQFLKTQGLIAHMGPAKGG
jgi:hypothetical protein